MSCCFFALVLSLAMATNADPGQASPLSPLSGPLDSSLNDSSLNDSSLNDSSLNDAPDNPLSIPSPALVAANQSSARLPNSSGTNKSMSGAAAPAWTLATRPCWEAAGAYHGIDPWLLYAIGYVESRHRSDAVGNNRNGTQDLGVMQINTVHLPRLAKYGIAREVLFNPCASTYIGAWILAENFRRYGHSWKAIAAYNVGSVNTDRRYRIGLNYARKVYEVHAALVQGRRPG